MHQQMPPPNEPGPLWSSASLQALCVSFDGKVRPALGSLALCSAMMSAAGLFSQFQNPDLYDFLLCGVMGLSLYQIARIMWAGCWELPNLVSKKPLLIYGLVASVGFGSYAAVSVTANLSATAGEASLDLAERGNIDGLDNASQNFVSYVSELQVLRAALFDRAAHARSLEQAEIAGRGPTGVAGRGSVSNSYAASAARYAQAAEMVGQILAGAETHIDGLSKAVEELRAAQINEDLSGAEKRAHLKVLSAEAIGEMRGLLALDPARTIRAAAASIARGVPTQSQANARSQARISEISTDMRLYASQLEAEADRIAALSPELPEQSTLSTAERLLQTAWRLPALTMAALLLDLCGWMAVGFRLALYQALRTRRREETERKVPNYITVEDFERVGTFVEIAAEAKQRVEAAGNAKKRGRPRFTKPATKLPKPKSSPTTRKPRATKGGDSDDKA